MSGRVAFDDFVTARSSALLRTAYLLTGDRAAAEDLLETALTRAWLRWRRIAGSPEADVRRILAATYLSGRQRERDEVPAAEPSAAGVPDLTDEAGPGPDLWRAMGRLPRRQRAVVVLHYAEDLPEADTGRVLGCGIGTVTSEVGRALTQLRVDPAPERAAEHLPYGIDDLRAALAEHAEISDDGVAGRGDRVVARGRAVRRRRRAGVLAAATAAVVAVAAWTLLPDDDTEPADAVVGVPIPETMTATGRTYEYAEKREDESGRVALHLPVSSEPRLVSWATGDDDQRVRVSGSDGESFTSTRPDLTDYVLVPPGGARELELAADAPVGLAVYTLADVDPEGLRSFGLSYRRDVGDRRLLTALVSQGSVPLGARTDVELGTGPLYFAPYCTYLSGEQPRYRIDIDGEEWRTGTCSGRHHFVQVADPGTGQELVRGLQGQPGDEVTVSVRTIGGGGPAPADVRVAVGVYAGPPVDRVVLGDPADGLVEHAGHTWRLTSVREGGADRMWAVVPSSEERMLVGFRVDAGARPGVTVRGSVGDRSAEMALAGGRGAGVLGVAMPGETAVLRVPDAGTTDRAALLFYELAD